MTVDPPRRLRPRAAQRNKTITTQTKGAPSAKGSTAAARPVTTKRHTSIYSAPSGGAVQTGTADVDAVSISGTTPTGGSSIAPYRSVMIGALAQGDPTAGKAVAVGYSAYIGPSSYEAIAIGSLAEATGNDAICIGTASADGVGAIAIGVGADAAATGAVAVGSGARAPEFSVAVGQGASAADVSDGLNVAVGDEALHANTDGVANTGIGQNALHGLTDGSDNTGLGQRALIVVQHGNFNSALGQNAGPASPHDPDYSTSVGALASASGNGSAAIGVDSSGNGAATTTDNEIALGTANHITIIAGKLVIADGSGGLHQIVVSTGGALSTVAYP